MKRICLLLACVNIFHCIPDEVTNTSLYIVLSSNSKQEVFACDSLNPYLLNLSNNHECTPFCEISNQRNYNDSTCLRRWKLDGGNYLQNEIAICLDVMDSTLFIDTIQILRQMETTIMLHFGGNSNYLGGDIMDTVLLNWTVENYQDTLFVELTNYR